jgi:phosphoribosylglycinamide formyltransferase-1
MRRIRTAVLISGSGSNMMSLVEAARDPAYPAEIALVVSNKLDAPGLEKARKAKIPVVGSITARSATTESATSD